MKKTVVIEVGIETDAPNDKIETLLQQYLDKHPFLQKLAFPIRVSMDKDMKVDGVKVTVKDS